MTMTPDALIEIARELVSDDELSDPSVAIPLGIVTRFATLTDREFAHLALELAAARERPAHAEAIYSIIRAAATHPTETRRARAMTAAMVAVDPDSALYRSRMVYTEVALLAIACLLADSLDAGYLSEITRPFGSIAEDLC
jgi:hypothetical protein